MRLSMLVGLCFLSTAALADPPAPPAYDPTNIPAHTPTQDPAITDIPVPGPSPAPPTTPKGSLRKVVTGPMAIPDGWALEFIQENGHYSRIGGYTSKAECEAAREAEMRRQHGANDHCIEWKAQHLEGNPPKTVPGHYIGSQDPAWFEK